MQDLASFTSKLKGGLGLPQTPGRKQIIHIKQLSTFKFQPATQISIDSPVLIIWIPSYGEKA